MERKIDITIHCSQLVNNKSVNFKN